MIDFVIMGIILLFLILLPAYKAEYIPDGNENFFDSDTSKAMRGFWSLIVIMVHIPNPYQNIIQELIGNFAYIGVTFFFLTSSYGILLAESKKNNADIYSWYKRLLKLLVTNFIINFMVTTTFWIFFGGTYNVKKIFVVDNWLKWLIGVYIIFFIMNIAIRNRRLKNILVCAFIIFISTLVYYLKYTGIVQDTTWQVELVGSVWGVIFAIYYSEIKEFFIKNWIVKLIIAFSGSMILGVIYLNAKRIPVVGDYLLKVMLGFMILLFIFVLNSKIKIGNKLNLFLGKISLEIYLIHRYIFRGIVRCTDQMASSFFVLLSIMITIVIATIMHILIDFFWNAIFPKKKGAHSFEK